MVRVNEQVHTRLERTQAELETKSGRRETLGSTIEHLLDLRLVAQNDPDLAAVAADLEIARKAIERMSLRTP